MTTDIIQASPTAQMSSERAAGRLSSIPYNLVIPNGYQEETRSLFSDKDHSELTINELEELIEAGNAALLANKDSEALVASLQIKLGRLQKFLDKKLELEINPLNRFDKVDSFESALKMAIENDGKVDAQEMAMLDKMVLRDREESNLANYRMRVLVFPSFTPFLGPIFDISFIETDENDLGFTETVNHNLRDAYQIAAADGEISEKEIELLQESMTK